MNNNSVYIDPLSGGYITLNNKLISINSVVSKINVLLKQPIGSNIYDLENGNPLLNTTGVLSISEITNGINFCLQPLISSGEISTLTITDIQFPKPTMRLVVNFVVTLASALELPLNWKR